MKINRSCRTCEWCFFDNEAGKWICAGAFYGKKLSNRDVQKEECWEIGPDYWEEIFALLTPEQQGLFNCPFPSTTKKEFARCGVKNEEEYLFYCIEHLDRDTP